MCRWLRPRTPGISGSGCPAYRRPRRSRADLPDLVKVGQTVGCSTLPRSGRPAPETVGRRHTVRRIVLLLTTDDHEVRDRDRKEERGR